MEVVFFSLNWSGETMRLLTCVATTVLKSSLPQNHSFSCKFVPIWFDSPFLSVLGILPTLEPENVGPIGTRMALKEECGRCQHWDSPGWCVGWEARLHHQSRLWTTVSRISSTNENLSIYDLTWVESPASGPGGWRGSNHIKEVWLSLTQLTLL
jgi:hypothetical protein